MEVENHLASLARDNLQLLVNSLWKLPTTGSDVGPLVTLPALTAALPRTKHVPVAREPTRWEKFARAKGIVKRKKGSHEYDEARRGWRPRHGAKSLKNDPMTNWITELKPGQDINDIEN